VKKIIPNFYNFLKVKINIFEFWGKKRNNFFRFLYIENRKTKKQIKKFRNLGYPCIILFKEEYFTGPQKAPSA